MAQKSFYGIIVSVVLAGLFIISFYNFALGVGYKYSIDSSINDEYINLTGLSSSAELFEDNSRAWEEKTQEQNKFTTGGDILLFGLWDTMSKMWNSAKIMFNIFMVGMARTLHVPALVLGIIVSLFTLALIFAGWRAIKSGE